MKDLDKEFDEKKLLCSDCKKFFGEEIKTFIRQREKELLEETLRKFEKEMLFVMTCFGCKSNHKFLKELSDE